MRLCLGRPPQAQETGREQGTRGTQAAVGHATRRLELGGEGCGAKPRQPGYLPNWVRPRPAFPRGGRQGWKHTLELPTFYHQRVVVVDFQAEKSGGPRAPESKAGFLWVVKGLQGAGRAGSGQADRLGCQERGPGAVRAYPPMCWGLSCSECCWWGSQIRTLPLMGSSLPAHATFLLDSGSGSGESSCPQASPPPKPLL